ncbi:hypothetical protein Anas_11138 [Armadillidium nasatum]|uniref:Uncharacterized protein n=1 Tax=Armadillidium nasatum TaxID=96803 RepID=A0A5N5TAD2_9CRUS|nr:hypothetical protein Anas_11138 [Armadillidium nasatum]
MRLTSITVILSVCFLSAFAQKRDGECKIDVNKLSVEKFMNEAPPDWSFSCLNKRLITETIQNKEHVKGILECIHPDHPVCTKKGYSVAADEIFRRADPSTGGRCPSCTPELASLVEYALKLMQKLHPRELRLGLSYLG